MNIAFDCYNEKLVKADRIDDSIKTQPFRFVCPICGQTVNPAAKDSTKQCTHFRHLHGNNDIECEKYLGTHGFNGLKNKIKASHKKKLDFYYSKPSKRLFIGLKFSQEEIEKYQNNNAELTISCSAKEPPFLAKKINATNFAANSREKLGLLKYSEKYSIRINNELLLLNTSVLSKSVPSFFKGSETNDDMNYKFVKSDIVYTNIPYIILLSSGNKTIVELKKYNSVSIIDYFDFKIDKNSERIYGVEVIFKEASDEIKRVLRVWGKNIEKLEQLNVLWPPIFEIEDCVYSNSYGIILYSSFEIEGNRSTDIKTENIEKNNFLYKISDYDEKKISYKNINLSLRQIEYKKNTDIITSTESLTKKFKVPNTNSFYLFSDDGVKKLIPGQTIYLTPNTQICEYFNNYKIRTIIFEGRKQLIGEELFRDILANNKQQIPFDFSVTSEYPKYIREYFNICKQVGMINAIVAKCIEEGLF